MIHRVALRALLLFTACTNHSSSHPKPAPTPKLAAPAPDTAAPTTPPGYRPPALIPDGYAPPPLLKLTPERQLQVYKRMEEHYVGQTVKRGTRVAPLPVAAEQLAPRVRWRGTTYDDLSAFMSDARLSGVLVLRDGAVAHSQVQRFGWSTAAAWSAAVAV